ncbi:ATP-dependent Clp protease proteolytic subunit [Streptomyces sp. NPDC058637]|uniref:ATP-dependent Clp protease proteolytic subunit n=1 Tax=Streptomyces sp. NPDC058637 TaxID=3346569 RepID=UPI00364ECA23
MGGARPGRGPDRRAQAPGADRRRRSLRTQARSSPGGLSGLAPEQAVRPPPCQAVAARLSAAPASSTSTRAMPYRHARASRLAVKAIYDTMPYLTCEVEAFCLGQAGSSAAVLLAPGRRHALPGARAVVRQPAPDEPVRGRLSDLGIEARESVRVRVRETLTAMPARHTGRSAQDIGADIERDTILDAPAALAYGIVDHVVENR